LTRRLERPVALVKRRTYHEISAMLLSGQLDAAWICDDPYVQYQDKLALLAVPLYRNKPLYQSYVIVNESSNAQSFDDIRGTVHAFSDPDSTSGYLVTRWMLALRQTTPAHFFRDSFFTYGHRNVIRAVGAGLAQSGSIDGYVWEVMIDREPELVRRTRIVFKSEWLGFPPIVAPMVIRDVPVVKALAAALLDMPTDALGREILSVLALDGFTTGTPDMYESTKKKWLIVKAQV
jgi:phosphonate transport system substrate-binding protein